MIDQHRLLEASLRHCMTVVTGPLLRITIGVAGCSLSSYRGGWWGYVVFRASNLPGLRRGRSGSWVLRWVIKGFVWSTLWKKQMKRHKFDGDTPMENSTLYLGEFTFGQASEVTSLPMSKRRAIQFIRGGWMRSIASWLRYTFWYWKGTISRSMVFQIAYLRPFQQRINGSSG